MNAVSVDGKHDQLGCKYSTLTYSRRYEGDTQLRHIHRRKIRLPAGQKQVKLHLPPREDSIQGGRCHPLTVIQKGQL